MCGVLLIDSNYSLIYDLSSSAAFFPLGTVQAVLINNQTSLKTRNKKGFELVPRAESKDPLDCKREIFTKMVVLKKLNQNEFSRKLKVDQLRGSLELVKKSLGVQNAD